MKLITALAALGAAVVLATGARSAGTAAAGGLAQLAGTSGCISQTAPDDTPLKGCAHAVGLLGAAAISVSPDGQNAYVASYDSNAVASFRRDPVSGALKQQNCVSANGTSGIDGTKGACADGNALAGAGSIAVSPDSAFVYATSSDADGIAIFAKGANGLTQVGCVRSVRTCVRTSALSGVAQIAITPDGKNAYAVAAGSDAVLMFARDATTGLLTPLGCISDDGQDGICKTGNALRGADAIVVSPDGKQVYVGTGTSNSVLTFLRDTETGLLTQRGCVMQDAPRPGSCVGGQGLASVTSLALSPDGRTLYASAYDSSAIAVLARTPATGALRWIGCESDLQGADEQKDGCGHGRPLASPQRVVVSKDGSRLYVTTESGVTFLSRDATTGALSVSGCLVSQDYWDDDLKSTCQLATNLASAYDLALSPDQKNVYVASYETSSITVLAPGPAISQMRLSKRGVLSARVSCPAEQPSACAGALSLSAAGVHAAAPYEVQPGTARDLRIPLTSAARRRLAHDGPRSAVISASDGSRALSPSRRLLLLDSRAALTTRAGRPH